MRLDKCAPKKSKYVGAKNIPFMNKKISKAIMDRTRLRNKFLKNRPPDNSFDYNQQRNLRIFDAKNKITILQQPESEKCYRQ